MRRTRRDLGYFYSRSWSASRDSSWAVFDKDNNHCFPEGEFITKSCCLDYIFDAQHNKEFDFVLPLRIVHKDSEEYKVITKKKDQA